MDYGPGFKTGRRFDLSPYALKCIGRTDDTVDARPATPKEISQCKYYNQNLLKEEFILNKRKIKTTKKIEIKKAGIETSSCLPLLILAGLGLFLLSGKKNKK